uniref:Uncharacterized protein n=1 Tax=Rhizophora mucronata TaxID=61149 RepID=A0A2P2NUF3_RHIMU
MILWYTRLVNGGTRFRIVLTNAVNVMFQVLAGDNVLIKRESFVLVLWLLNRW